MSADIPAGYESGSFEYPTSVGVLSRRVIRGGADGPAIVLIHESPGLSSTTFDVATVLRSAGYRVVLPVLLDGAWSWKGLRPAVANIAKLCVAREITALSLGQTSPIVEWLRGLADLEAAASGRPVGVIGMCFSGGFALGTIADPSVGAAVLSQPALPFVFRFGRSDLGVSSDDLGRIKERIGGGECLRAMRFSRDRISPKSRLKLIHDTFPDAQCRTVETAVSRHHSVLAMAAQPDAWPDLRAALDETVAFLDTHLKPDGSPTGPP